MPVGCQEGVTLTCTRGLTGVAEIQAVVSFVGFFGAISFALSWSLCALLYHDVVAAVQSCLNFLLTVRNWAQFPSVQVQAQSDTSSIAPCLHRREVKSLWTLASHLETCKHMLHDSIGI